MQHDNKYREILTPAAFEVNRMTNLYVGLLADEIVRASGIAEFLKDGAKTPLQVMKGMSYKPYALPALNWLLRYASETSLVDRMAGSESYSRWNRDSLGAELLKLDPGLQPFIEYLSLIAQDYPKFFRGELSGPQVVFLEGRKRYWQYFFANEFSTYRICNEFFGLGVTAGLEKKSGNFDILEIGAGTGGATSALLNIIRQGPLAGRLKKYIFTDVASGFLKNAETIIPEILPQLPFESKLLDINQNLQEQGLAPGSVDVVYSVNCIHVAKDLVECLKQIRTGLKDGGQLHLAEIIRPVNRHSIPEEMIFCLLSSYTDVRLKAESRPTFGFLTTDNWRACLLEAGYSKVDIVTIAEAGGRPDLPPCAAVITGWR